jgi:hypothetical protein
MPLLISLIIYRRNIGQTVNHLIFRTHLIQDLLMNYSMQHKTSSHHGDGNTVKRQTEWHFPKRMPPTENKSEPT